MLRRSLIFGTGVTAALLLPLALFGETAVRLWAGPEAVPTRAVLYWMAAWNLVLAPAQAIAAFLNAAGKVAVQVWAGLATAAVNVILSVWLARAYGPAASSRRPSSATWRLPLCPRPSWRPGP